MPRRYAYIRNDNYGAYIVRVYEANRSIFFGSDLIFEVTFFSKREAIDFCKTSDFKIMNEKELEQLWNQ